MTTICQLIQVRAAEGVLQDVTLAIGAGAKIGVLGPNGAGKSTLLRIIANVEDPSAGQVIHASGTSIGLLPQDPLLDLSGTVLDNIQGGVAETRGLLCRYEQLSDQLSERFSIQGLDELGAVQGELEKRNAWTLDSQLQQAMDALRCPPTGVIVATLSGGERRRVALCALLLQQPDLLLLDEPTNHLDTDTISWLEQHLHHYFGTVVTVTHDRYFLDNIADHIVELDRGHAHSYPGNYSAYLTTKQIRTTIRGRNDSVRHQRITHELASIRSRATGGGTIDHPRLQPDEQMASGATHTRAPACDDIQIPSGPRLGSLVIEVENLTKLFGDRTLIHGLTFSLPRNAIVGVLGPNGVGKTTLLSLLGGTVQPDSGTIRVGETVRIAYLEQNRVPMEPDESAWELVSDGQAWLTIGRAEIASRAYLASFGFRGQDQQKPARLFSGGEQARLNLALTLKHGANLLLLDEPTNDLDIQSLASLENALLTFPGCAIITTHDRWFLDRVATHILAWAGASGDPGRWRWFEGNYSAYQTSKTRRSGDSADRLRQAAYRKLARG